MLEIIYPTFYGVLLPTNNLLHCFNFLMGNHKRENFFLPPENLQIFNLNKFICMHACCSSGHAYECAVEVP